MLGVGRFKLNERNQTYNDCNVSELIMNERKRLLKTLRQKGLTINEVCKKMKISTIKLNWEKYCVTRNANLTYQC